MSIDLNSDLGEGFGAWTLGDDEALLDLVTSANVACGFHAGDPSIMRRVCTRAAARGVAIGAQVGYRENRPGAGAQPWAENVVRQIGLGLGARGDRITLRHHAVAEAGDLRKDEPHPVRPFAARSQLGQRVGVTFGLRLDEAA